MPMSEAFKERLFPLLPDIAAHFGTPFHLYDEAGIRETGETMNRVFSPVSEFREYFAVKALPNPAVLSIMRSMGFGFDCSSVPELMLARNVGARGTDIMFTSNNTTVEEFSVALSDGGCILNLDDLSLISKVPEMPEVISFRYNPGPKRTGTETIGDPVEAKYGLTEEQIFAAYEQAQSLGARRFGLHTMLISNELNYKYMVDTAEMILELAGEIGRRLDIRFEFVNLGGGIGIPYKPEQAPFDVDALAREIKPMFADFENTAGYRPKLFFECGRYMTGPHGVLVCTAVNRKEIYRTYIGLDACMSSLMRPAMYGAYHHIDVLGKETEDTVETVDIVGSLCENNDKFAIQRALPEIETGDIVVIQDTGAHGHAMGFNYNGRLRPKELLLRLDGNVELIRREETVADHFITLNFTPDVMTPERLRL